MKVLTCAFHMLFVLQGACNFKDYDNCGRTLYVFIAFGFMFLLFLFELIVGEAYLQNYCKFLFLIDIIDAMKTIYFPIILVAASVETYSIELHVMSDLKLQ